MKADIIKVTHPEHSYGIFCWNSLGDLFLSSDWGMYGFSWRSFGKDFKQFLLEINEDYVFNKFDQNSRYLHGKGLPKHVRPHVIEDAVEQIDEEIIRQEYEYQAKQDGGGI